MPAAPVVGSDAEKQLRSACAELDRSLRAGELCRAERFFAAYPLLASEDEHAVELIYTEFVTREELGQRPTPEEFYARFPRWQRRLRRQFQVHNLLREGLDDDTPGEAGDLPAAEAETLPRRLGNYELREELARGGCGVVYKAWQHGLDRVVAVKELRSEYARLLRARQRFCEEARVMARLGHRHVVPVHDVGECDGRIYFSMAFAEGGCLAGRVGEFRGRRGARLLETVARAVHHAHEQGVVHRDLKPSNVLLDADGQPWVSDFGLAGLAAGEADEDGPGPLVGTPAYMAPEQIAATGPVGPAADVWALGVILYELLAGARPFVADTFAALQQRIVGAEPPPLGAAAALQSVCTRALAKEPGRRYATALELADDLRRTLGGAAD
jgi:serine/threonine protein kinase